MSTTHHTTARILAGWRKAGHSTSKKAIKKTLFQEAEQFTRIEKTPSSDIRRAS